MKMLTFQARRFRWKSFSKTLPEVEDQDVDKEVTDAVVVYFQMEAKDESEEERRRVFRHALKHIKWLANKRKLANVVLHSFAHLGGANSDATFARQFLQELAERLTTTGYQTDLTPFGYFCEWELSVYGDSLAKVWKEV